MSKSRKHPNCKHVVVTPMGGQIKFLCEHCSKEEIKDLPQSVDALKRIGNHFIEEHKNCKEKKK